MCSGILSLAWHDVDADNLRTCLRQTMAGARVRPIRPDLASNFKPIINLLCDHLPDAQFAHGDETMVQMPKPKTAALPLGRPRALRGKGASEPVTKAHHRTHLILARLYVEDGRRAAATVEAVDAQCRVILV